MDGISWWNRLSESVRPKGLIYTCREGHELFIEADKVSKWIKDGTVYLPNQCPECRDIERGM